MTQWLEFTDLHCNAILSQNIETKMSSTSQLLDFRSFHSAALRFSIKIQIKSLKDLTSFAVSIIWPKKAKITIFLI